MSIVKNTLTLSIISFADSLAKRNANTQVCLGSDYDVVGGDQEVHLAVSQPCDRPISIATTGF